MTNAELAIKVRQGEEIYVNELWEQTRKLIYYFASRYYALYRDRCLNAGVDMEDLKQEGYFSLMDAVKAFRPADEFSFNSYLRYPLKNRFDALIGIRTRRSKAEPLNNAISLETPIDAEDPTLTLLDMIPDPAAEAAYDDVLDSVFSSELQGELQEILEELPDFQGEIIKERFLERKTYKVISEERRVSIEWTRQTEQRGLRALRRGKPLSRLKLYQKEIIDRYAYHGSLSAFKNNQASSTEIAAMKLYENKD